MNLEWHSISAAGEIANERAILKATSEIDIGRFAIFRCRAGESANPQSGSVPNCYWFADKVVQAGDFVVVYSKAGTRSEKRNDDGTSSYFFYWGLPSAIWLKGFFPVLVATPTWSTRKTEFIQKVAS
jgi:hypothetical protein